MCQKVKDSLNEGRMEYMHISFKIIYNEILHPCAGNISFCYFGHLF